MTGLKQHLPQASRRVNEQNEQNGETRKTNLVLRRLARARGLLSTLGGRLFGIVSCEWTRNAKLVLGVSCDGREGDEEVWELPGRSCEVSLL